MQLILYSVLSFLFIAAVTVQAAPSANGNGILQARSPHHVPYVAARHHQQRAPHLVPPTLQAGKKVRRASNSTQPLQKKCRLRPTSSTVALPTTTGTVAGASTGVVVHTTSVSSSTSTSINSTSTSQAAPSPTVENFSNQWKLGKSHQGHSFFDGWTFWNLPDPTNGNVNFLDYQSALNAGLLQFNDNQPAYMRLGTQDNVQNRDSVRIHDQETFNVNTLLLMDAEHMPVGCGVWPAWWTNGPNWPNGGEIDILEGVNDQQQNQATLHTSEGCYAQSDPNHPSSGQLLNANCGVVNGDNTGCGFADVENDNSYGRAFNDNKGGVYAMQWVNSGISVWFFPRGNIPADITANHPMPWTWKAPFAFWASSGCNPNQFFNDNFAIFDITTCGDWAGSAGSWSGSGCAASTGKSTCGEYVSGAGSNFAEAYWAVNYVKYFHQNT